MPEGIITNIINNIFHIFWLLSITIEPKHSYKKTVFITIFYTLLYQVFTVIVLCNMPHAIAIASSYFVAIIVFGAIYIFGISDSHPAKSLFFISVYYCLWTLVFNIISIVSGTFGGAGNIMIWMMRIALNLLFLLLYWIFFRRFLIRVYKGMKSGYKLASIISIQTFLMMSVIMIYNNVNKHYSNFMLFIIFYFYVFIITIYVALFIFIAQSVHKHQLEQMQMHEKLMLSQIEFYQKTEQKLRQTRHDFRHHNIVVAEFARNKDYKGILDYLHEYGIREDAKYFHILCNNLAVQHVLEAYINKAQEHGIVVKTNISTGVVPGISDIDLVSVIANIMENAINGCIKACRDRHIYISVQQRGAKLVIICQNTCVPEIVFKNGVPVNENRNGIGVESIKNSVEKYAGNVDFSASGGVFVCRAILSCVK